jgi:hypothetical protein
MDELSALRRPPQHGRILERSRAIDFAMGSDERTGSLEPAGVVAERAAAALVGHAPLAVDEVEAVGECRVGALGAVVELVDDDRERDIESLAAPRRDLLAVLPRARLADLDPGLVV